MLDSTMFFYIDLLSIIHLTRSNCTLNNFNERIIIIMFHAYDTTYAKFIALLYIALPLLALLALSSASLAE